METVEKYLNDEHLINDNCRILNSAVSKSPPSSKVGGSLYSQNQSFELPSKPEMDFEQKRQKREQRIEKGINFMLNSGGSPFIYNRLTSNLQQKAQIQANLKNFAEITNDELVHEANPDILFCDASLSLLEPKSWYFKLLYDVLDVEREEATASLEGFSKWICKKSNKNIYFPVIKAGKYNPYKKMRSSRSSASRRFKVLKFIEKITKKKVYLCNLVLTYPKELSNLLFEDPNGDEKAWNCLKIFIKKYNSTLGYWCNLHQWKSSNPFASHYHFHLSFPNFYYDKKNKKLVRIRPFLSRGEEDKGIKQIKKLWCESIREGLNLENTATIYGDFKDVVNEETININFSYKKRKSEQLHSLKYCTRSWLFDVADYFDGCDGDNDEVRFTKYYPYLKKQFKKFAKKGCIQNRTRVFGFLTDFVDIVRDNDLFYEWKLAQKVAICPICAGDCECSKTSFNGFRDIKTLNVYIAIKTKYKKIGEVNFLSGKVQENPSL